MDVMKLAKAIFIAGKDEARLELENTLDAVNQRDLEASTQLDILRERQSTIKQEDLCKTAQEREAHFKNQAELHRQTAEFERKRAMHFRASLERTLCSECARSIRDIEDFE